MHDASVCQPGVYERAGRRHQARERTRLPVNINCTLFNTARADQSRRFFDSVMIWVSTAYGVAGYAYERLRSAALPQPRQDQATIPRHFQTRPRRQKVVIQPVEPISGLSRRQSTLSLHALGQSTRTIFGWQKPCYLLAEGYAKTFRD